MLNLRTRSTLHALVLTFGPYWLSTEESRQTEVASWADEVLPGTACQALRLVALIHLANVGPTLDVMDPDTNLTWGILSTGGSCVLALSAIKLWADSYRNYVFYKFSRYGRTSRVLVKFSLWLVDRTLVGFDKISTSFCLINDAPLEIHKISRYGGRSHSSAVLGRSTHLY